MTYGGNGAQESSLGWELSHGAPDPSLVEGFRPSADFHPCLNLFTILSPASTCSRLFVWVILFVFGFSMFLNEVFGFMVLWYSQLTLTAAAVSVAQHATESHSLECEQRAGESRLFFMLFPFLCDSHSGGGLGWG